ncbi:nucleolar transcription factor 1-B-like isoform X2 [Myripristis murdjan]|uniref:nucleolar transcription factor 1-B-like isoform X2 n=1 Tax=Myripristis murdjan TaxID=586833 RepID=UPI001176124B|nr:nucleolar transcription factor 1-B-like isoform X2 [Myripristis murdjan]
MSQEPAEAGEKVWSKSDLQRLLHAMKRRITKCHEADIYSKGQRILEWDKVAFQPYSAQECKQKWQDISQKIRKIRTLTELIVEAEDTINNSKPALPVRPGPANAIFFQENFAKFKKKHPELSRQKLFKLASKKYTDLPPHKKAIYVNKFQLARDEYMQRKLQLRIPHHKSQSSKDKGRTNEDQLGPGSGPPDKPPVSAYQLFCKEHWGSCKGLPNQIFLCAQRWHKMPQEEKDNYKTRCNQLRSEHEKKRREYLYDYSEEQQQQIQEQYGLKKPPKVSKRRKSALKFPGEPPMPSRSGHLLFCRKQIKLVDTIMTSRERMSKASQMWHGLSQEEKDDYKKEADSNFREYTVKLKTWFKSLTASEQEDYRQHNRSKCKYIDGKIKVHSKEAMAPSRPSDSEDEDLEDSSSDEEEHLIMEESEEEEKDDIVTLCV